MTPEEHLLAAADDMAQHGQAKDVFLKDPFEWETTPACAYGSLARVAGAYEVRTCIGGGGRQMAEVYISSVTPAAVKLAKHLRAKFPDLFGEVVADELRGIDDTYTVITTYNDADTTTAEDMILAFKEAAHG